MSDCFICGGKLSLRKDGDYDCEGCRRILYRTDDNLWATRRTKVKLKKLPEEGDNYSDCIEVE